MGSGYSAPYGSAAEALADGKTPLEIADFVDRNAGPETTQSKARPAVPPKTYTPCSKDASKQGRSAWAGPRVHDPLPGLRAGSVTTLKGRSVRLDSLWSPAGLVLLYIRRLG